MLWALPQRPPSHPKTGQVIEVAAVPRQWVCPSPWLRISSRIRSTPDSLRQLFCHAITVPKNGDCSARAGGRQRLLWALTQCPPLQPMKGQMIESDQGGQS